VSLAVIAPTIIPGVEDPAALVQFYEDAYSGDPAQGARYERWRALGALGKADHVIALCEGAGVSPASTLEVGCGDGALLAELHRRHFGGSLAGVEIAQAAVAIAAARPELDWVSVYDGSHLQLAEASFELGILSHVLEHVPDPAALLREVARVCETVLVEVPLEANWSARRAGKREHALEIGHLHRLDRAAAREIVARAGLSILGELEDPLPIEVHRFFAGTPRAKAAGSCKWLLRSATHRVAARLARRAFTLHYACLCRPPAA
jgi:SAM-dependent methyltransferase